MRHGLRMPQTDGSVRANVAAFGVHIRSADLSFQAGVPEEDQSAFRAEVEGLHTYSKHYMLQFALHLTHLASAL